MGHWVMMVNQVGGEAFGSAPHHAKPRALAPSWHPQHPPARATSQERLFSSFPFHGGDRGLQLPPALPPPQALLPAVSALAPRKRAKAFACSRAGESCRAEAAALRRAGGAPWLSCTERSGHGIDILFFFFLSFFL